MRLAGRPAKATAEMTTVGHPVVADHDTVAVLQAPEYELDAASAPVPTLVVLDGLHSS